MQKVATMNALVAFAFSEGRLSFVSVNFPQPGTSVTTKGRVAYQRHDKASADNIVTVVRSGLETNYGPPPMADVTLKKMGAPAQLDPLKAVWTVDGCSTEIHLLVKPEPDEFRFDVVVNCGVPDSRTPEAEKTRGL